MDDQLLSGLPPGGTNGALVGWLVVLLFVGVPWFYRVTTREQRHRWFGDFKTVAGLVVVASLFAGVVIRLIR